MKITKIKKEWISNGNSYFSIRKFLRLFNEYLYSSEKHAVLS